MVAGTRMECHYCFLAKIEKFSFNVKTAMPFGGRKLHDKFISDLARSLVRECCACEGGTANIDFLVDYNMKFY